MNAIELIKQDHRRIEEFFEQFLDAESDMTQEDLFQEIETGLRTHAEMEERALYPALQDIAPEKVDEALKEHAEVKELLNDLLDADLNEETFEAGFRRLAQEVRRHVKEEEAPGGILELASESLSEALLSDIMKEMVCVQLRTREDLAA